MRGEFEVQQREVTPPRSTGLTLVGLLAGAVVAAVLLGQLTGPDPVPRRPAVAVTIDDPELPTPEPDRPIGVDSLRRCAVELGGFILGDDVRARGSGLERWDCGALTDGPYSVVIRTFDGHFGVHSAVVTYPVDLTGNGVPSVSPPDGWWKSSVQTLIWPLGNDYAQIVGDLGQSMLEKIATRVTLNKPGDGDYIMPHLTTPPGFLGPREVTYRSPVAHEMRYGTADLGLKSKLGDGMTFTGLVTGASFESQVFQSRGESAGQVRAKPAGLVRGLPAIYSGVQGGNGTLAWESEPGEVSYIGFSGSAATESVAIETLRALANKGRYLTPAQWGAKDRLPVAVPTGSATAHQR